MSIRGVPAGGHTAGSSRPRGLAGEGGGFEGLVRQEGDVGEGGVEVEAGDRLGVTAVDVGCAAGGSFSFCLEANPVLNYTGIDVSKSLIELARSIYPEATFLNYDGHALPFSDNHFDLVFSLGVLHHLHHWQSLIKQMVKCSKKYTVFDLRLTNRNTLNNPTKYYQKVSFDNHWDNKTAISYIVVNFHEFIKFIKENFGNDGSRIESYGYFAKPTELANIPYDQIFMCSLKFEKNSKSPGVFIDIPD